MSRLVVFVGSRRRVGLGNFFCVDSVQGQRFGLAGSHRNILPGTNTPLPEARNS
jgi:hypothetical protein